MEGVEGSLPLYSNYEDNNFAEAGLLRASHSKDEGDAYEIYCTEI
jgi:hypothetical protein